MIEHITHDGQTIAFIIRDSFHAPGITFITPDNFSQQLAYMSHPCGKVLQSHFHNPHSREVVRTQEVLVIKRGKLRVDFYDTDRQYLESAVVGAGDVLLLASGGHGFEVIEDVTMIEIKQGPYAGDADKTRIPCVAAENIVIKKSPRE